jgi:alpha-tubulin suppressor-like RCC1 family protein
VFTWGSYKGSSGHMGYTAETSRQTTPKLMDNLTTDGARVVKIRSGANHTAVVTNAGTALAWGYSEQGQLGKVLVQLELRGNRHNGVALTPHPLRVYCMEDVGGSDSVPARRRRKLEEIADVFCGGYCTFILTTTGKVCRRSRFPTRAAGAVAACARRWEPLVSVPPVLPYSPPPRSLAPVPTLHNGNRRGARCSPAV